MASHSPQYMLLDARDIISLLQYPAGFMPLYVTFPHGRIPLSY